jgi:hypothetical protein
MNFKFKWYHYLILLGILSLAVYLFITFRIYVYILFGIITLNFLWKTVFCREKKQTDGSMIFNLSRFAEWIYISFIASFSFAIFYFLFTAKPVWYQWIIPSVLCLAYFAKCFEIIKNMNDSIKITLNEICWVDNGNEIKCKPKNCHFSYDETEAIQTNLYRRNHGWFLNITDEENNVYKLDLKMMNLNGHKKSIEKILKKNDLIKSNK